MSPIALDEGFSSDPGCRSPLTSESSDGSDTVMYLDEITEITDTTHKLHIITDTKHKLDLTPSSTDADSSPTDCAHQNCGYKNLIISEILSADSSLVWSRSSSG